MQAVVVAAAKVVCRVLCVLLLGVPWRGLAKVLRMVRRRLLSRVE